MDHLRKVRRKRKSKSYHVTRFVRSSSKHIFSIAANIGKGQMSPEQRRERERASKKVGVRGAMWNMVALIATRHVRTDTVQVAIRQVFDFRGSSLIRVALCLCLHVGLCVCNLPSRRMLACRHLANRHAWHWLRRETSTTHLPPSLHTYSRFLSGSAKTFVTMMICCT